jgi:trehalose 6-phosphate phosphatase
MSDLVTISEPPVQLLDDASLFLDLDGTILELAETPGGVHVSDALKALLAHAARQLSGRLAFVSGRAADDVAALMSGLAANIGGSHGLEVRWADGRANAPQRAPMLDHALAEMRRLQARHEGLLVEDKPFGVALHYRLAPHLEAECRDLAQRLSRETGLPLQAGKMVQELKTSPASKGDAVEAFMAEPPMRGSRPVFIGDDLNDEAGFSAAARLGGAGILVGAPRATAAQWRLENVPAVHAWLRRGLGDAQ